MSTSGEGSSASGARPPPQLAAVAMPWCVCSPWVPKFLAESSGVRFGEWRAQMEAILRAQGLTEWQQSDFIMGALDGRAKRETMLFNQAQRDSPLCLWTALQNRFGSLTPPPTLRSRFFHCNQGSEELLGDFFLRTRESFGRWLQAEPDGSAKEESTLQDQFIKGLK